MNRVVEMNGLKQKNAEAKALADKLGIPLRETSKHNVFLQRDEFRIMGPDNLMPILSSMLRKAEKRSKSYRKKAAKLAIAAAN